MSRSSLAKPWYDYVGLESLQSHATLDASDAASIVWLDIDNTLYSHMETRYVEFVAYDGTTAFQT